MSRTQVTRRTPRPGLHRPVDSIAESDGIRCNMAASKRKSMFLQHGNRKHCHCRKTREPGSVRTSAKQCNRSDEGKICQPLCPDKKSPQQQRRKSCTLPQLDRLCYFGRFMLGSVTFVTGAAVCDLSTERKWKRSGLGARSEWIILRYKLHIWWWEREDYPKRPWRDH